METKRMVNTGAEHFLGKEIPVFDKGFIKLVDYLGCDNTVVAAARHSYDKGLDQEDTVGNEKLINFLMREKHTSPFEQPALVFEVKAPILVFREWHRHRTAKLNEMSARYTEMPTEFYVPAIERVQTQSKTNKQGSGEAVSPDAAERFIENALCSSYEAFDVYRRALNEDIAKELARIVLPVNTYSKMVWQCDLHNLLNFLRLRMAPTAQYEIRMFANEIAKVVAASFPVTWDAFKEYVLGAVTLSRTEAESIAHLIQAAAPESHTYLSFWKKFAHVS